MPVMSAAAAAGWKVVQRLKLAATVASLGAGMPGLAGARPSCVTTLLPSTLTTCGQDTDTCGQAGQGGA
jgi:hypothetical protein